MEKTDFQEYLDLQELQGMFCQANLINPLPLFLGLGMGVGNDFLALVFGKQDFPVVGMEKKDSFASFVKKDFPVVGQGIALVFGKMESFDYEGKDISGGQGIVHVLNYK